jgi:hypothetical protein
MSTAQVVQLSIDDTINYRVYVSKAVPLADATVTANLEILVSNRDNNEDLDARIRTALRDFIAVDWEILGQERSSATTGYERIKLKALAKVAADQNRNLEERARKANREGLEFGQIAVNRALTQDQVGQVMKELWFEAVSKVNEHLVEFNRASGRQWRIGDVILGAPDGGFRARNAKGGYREELDDMLGDLVESGLSGAEKVSLIANVTLKSERPAGAA